MAYFDQSWSYLTNESTETEKDSCVTVTILYSRGPTVVSQTLFHKHSTTSGLAVVQIAETGTALQRLLSSVKMTVTEVHYSFKDACSKQKW